MIEKGSFYFVARSFVPGTIFKTELFDSICVLEGYANIHNFFPYFPFANKSLENNFSIYISQKNIIDSAGTRKYDLFSNGIYLLSAWINTCSIIKDKNIRKNAVYSLVIWINSLLLRDKNILKNTVYTPWAFGGTRSLIIRSFAAITWDKMMKEKEFSKNILYLIYSILSTFGFDKEIFLILLILPISIMPRLLFKLFLKLYMYLNYDLKGKNIPSQWNILFSDKKIIDPLRKFYLD